MGPAPGLPGFYHACAFTFGIVQAGGAGKSIAEWVVNGHPEWDMWPLDSRRYLPHANNKFTLAKAIETYQHEYGIGYPQEERPAGRPAKTSPCYQTLKNKGAKFGVRGGWERAIYFPQPGDKGGIDTSFRRPHWHEAVKRECEAVEKRVAVLDLPGFTKFEIKGPGARAWIDGMVTGVVPKPGRTALNYFCAPSGGIVTEMTVTTLGPEHFWLISAASGELHDEHWLVEHLPADGSVRFENLTARHGTLILVGPRSREVLAKLTSTDLSNAAFPWLSVQTIEMGYAKVLAFRVNYVGELGWELHIPVEHVQSIYELLWEAGQEFGIADFGLYAMESLRLEKCYRSWKADLTTEYTPAMASLDRFVKLEKPGGFIGQEALKREAVAGPKEKFVPLIVEAADADAPAVSIVYHGDTVVGLVTSGGFGYRLNKSIALAYVRTDLAVAGTQLEVEILGERRKAVVATEPLYDPANARLRA